MASIILSIFVTFVMSVSTSLIAAYLWARHTQIHSFGSSAGVNMKGQWLVTTKIKDQEFTETLTIHRQILGRLKGVGTIKRGDSDTIKFGFEGHLIDRNTVMCRILPGQKEIHDYATGIIQIDDDGMAGRGFSVVVGVFAGSYSAPPVVAEVELRRCSGTRLPSSPTESAGRLSA